MRELGFTRKRREIEPRWVSEYVATFHSRFPVKFRCPLGPIPEELKKLYGAEKARRMYRPSRPEVDALSIQPGALVLIEAKIFKYMDGLAKLPIYKSLVPVTPELRQYLDREVEMHLLIPHEIPWVKTACIRNNVELKVWTPDWIREIWEDRDKYWTAPKVFERERRKKVLRDLGFE